MYFDLPKIANFFDKIPNGTDEAHLVRCVENICDRGYRINHKNAVMNTFIRLMFSGIVNRGKATLVSIIFSKEGLS
jgi:hypothetical protein